MDKLQFLVLMNIKCGCTDGGLGDDDAKLPRGAEYCDERVCPSKSQISVHTAYGRGSLLWRRCDMYISGFVGDVMLAIIRPMAQATQAWPMLKLTRQKRHLTECRVCCL